MQQHLLYTASNSVYIQFILFHIYGWLLKIYGCFSAKPENCDCLNLKKTGISSAGGDCNPVIQSPSPLRVGSREEAPEKFVFNFK